MPNPPEKLTVDLTPNTVGALHWLTQRSVDTQTDSVNRAIQVYAWLEQLRASGGTLMCRDPEGTLQEIKYY